MEKQRKLVSYEKLSPGLQEHIMRMSHRDYKDKIVPVRIPNRETFYALMLETEDAVYLVKGDWLKKSVAIESDTEADSADEDDNNLSADSGGEKEMSYEGIGEGDEDDDY